MRANEWEQYLLDRERAVELAAQAAEAGDADIDEDAADAGGGGGGGGAAVNGVQVPQLLLDRTQAALERFGVTR